MVCQFLLYNKVNLLYIHIYPHISSLLCLPPTLPLPCLQVVTKLRAHLPVLCGCFPLAIYFTFGSTYKSCHALTSSQLTLPPPRVLKSILYICVFIPALPLASFFFLIENRLSFMLKFVHSCKAIKILLYISANKFLSMVVIKNQLQPFLKVLIRDCMQTFQV